MEIVKSVVLLACFAFPSSDSAHVADASDAEDHLSVRTAAGEVRGRWQEAAAAPDAGRFAAFLGIPFARPPVGHLRFKFPKPVEPWSGHFDASRDPPPCPQINITIEAREVVGQEDCLYLNVYVPDRTPKVPKGLWPVLFVVHGGAFDHGSGRMEDFGPDYLLHNDVMVVSPNYRLGPFGFTSIDTEDIPGNAGVKDLVAALRWVQNNIAAFGGDPARVTALGWSTGASAVHILSLLPTTRGLFSRMVLMSGHAISPRAYTERHVERANTLAAILGAADNRSETITATLMGATVERLLRANDDPRMRRVGHPLPSPERRETKGSEPKLLQHDPESLLRQPRAAPISTLIGMGGREGTFPFKTWGLDALSPEAQDELLPRLLPADVLPGADTAAMLGLGQLSAGRAGPGPLSRDAAIRLAQLVRSEYSGGGPIANSTDTFIEFLGDSFIYASMARAVSFMANASTDTVPVRIYNFLVDDEYNYGKKLYQNNYPGASHVDDLGYIGRFTHEPDLHQDLTKDGVAPKTVVRMSNLITTFAKGDVASRLPHWPAVPRSAAEPWPVLFVGPGLSLQVGHLDAPHHYFWTSVYSDLRSKTSSIGRD